MANGTGGSGTKCCVGKKNWDTEESQKIKHWGMLGEIGVVAAVVLVVWGCLMRVMMFMFKVAEGGTMLFFFSPNQTINL